MMIIKLGFADWQTLSVYALKAKCRQASVVFLSCLHTISWKEWLRSPRVTVYTLEINHKYKHCLHVWKTVEIRAEVKINSWPLYFAIRTHSNAEFNKVKATTLGPNCSASWTIIIYQFIVHCLWKFSKYRNFFCYYSQDKNSVLEVKEWSQNLNEACFHKPQSRKFLPVTIGDGNVPSAYWS